MSNEFFDSLDKQVIFEDNHLLAINKKPSQIVQGDKTGDASLSDLYKEYLKIKYNKPGNVFCGVIHRLDRPVSGVVLMAKTSKALSRMNDKFKNREIAKTYLAIVRGTLNKEQGQLVNYLAKNEKNNKSYITKSESQGQKAELSYEVNKIGDTCSLISVKPVTGRHHQIRVQLSNISHPIIGDVKYGDRRGNDDRSICLHAWQLAFEHPVSKEAITIEAQVPDQKFWNVFNKR